MRFTAEALLMVLLAIGAAVGVVWLLRRRAVGEPLPPTIPSKPLPPSITHPSPWVSPASTVTPSRTPKTVPATSTSITTGKASFIEGYTTKVAGRPQTTYRQWQEQQASIVANYLTVGGAPSPQPKATYLKGGRPITGATLMGVPVSEIRGTSKPVPSAICIELMRQGYTRYEAGEIYARSGAAPPSAFPRKK